MLAVLYRSHFTVRNVAFCVVVAVVLASASGAWAGPSPGEPAEGLYVLDPTASTPTLLIKGEEDEVTWSPDGRWISALDVNDYYFNILDTSGGNRHRVQSFLWSNDGSRIAYRAVRAGSDGPVFVSPATWSKPRLVTRARHSDPLAWAPDDRHFVYGTGGDECCFESLVVVTASGARPRTVLKTGGPYSVAWSPERQALAVVGYDQYIYLASANGGRARRLPGKWGGFPHPQWFPDGKSFVVYPAEAISSTGRFDAVQVSVPGGARKIVCRNCESYDLSLDHRSIAFVDANGTLWVEKADRTGKRRITGPVFLPRWSPNSRSLVFATAGATDGVTKIAVADVATGEVTTLTDGTHQDVPYGISADGRFVAFDRWSQETGHELWVVPTDGTEPRKVMSFGTCSRARWSPTGALLAITNLDDC